ncbi:SurA N-terminal domain-containing protein [Paenibacillus swuensis]|uniref:SurA N-terminal domain-containing protein n=1 Tax=Paenibacillus swuensis TaxID=1178515 RepID=UPI00083923F9|nr:SurA N-terminal domain-containing protein [Paenibacillus swuensis]
MSTNDNEKKLGLNETQGETPSFGRPDSEEAIELTNAEIESELEREALLAPTDDRITEEAERAGTVPPSDGRRSNGVWIGATVVLAALLAVSLVSNPFGKKDVAVATVNGVEISQDQMYDEMVKAGGAQTVDKLITEEVLGQELEAKKIALTDADYDAEIAKVKKSFPSEDEFQQALQQYGMTMEDLKAQIKTQLQVKKLLEPGIKVTDDQVKKYYTDNKATFGTATLEEKKVEIKDNLINTEVANKAPAYLEELKGKAKITNTLEKPATDAPATAPATE